MHAEFRDLLRGAVEGAIFPDLQIRPHVPAWAPVAEMQEIDEWMAVIGIPKKAIEDAIDYMDKVGDAVSEAAIGVVFKDYPRIKKGLTYGGRTLGSV